MSSAVAVSTPQEVHQDSQIVHIPLERISESKTNPRTHFDEKKLAELAANIKQQGVFQPVLVRPRPNAPTDAYELVVGARRFRASKLSCRETIPATVRELTDAQVIEIQLVENLQREDVHELDEASGYAALLDLNPNVYTVEGIAAKVGKSPAYVNGRLQLLRLVDEAKQAFRASKLTITHAFEIARLQDKDQRRALQECFPEHRSTTAMLKDKRAEAITVRQLREWIEREVHLDLSNAPFDAQDAALVPSAGSCAKCPKRTGNNPLLFPEANLKKSTCTDRECYRSKVAALVQIRVKPLEAGGDEVLRVSQAPSWQTKNQPANVLYEGQFRRAKEGGECPTTRTAVMIDGRNAGTVFHVCQNDKCTIHARVSRYQPTPQERAERAKEALAERVEKQTRFRVLDAVRKKLPSTTARPDFEMAVLDYFRRLGHDNHRRLCKVYGWEEKKSKAPLGAFVDYEKIAASAVQTMSAADLNHFFIVCALASDLYCPGYNPKEPLGKDSNLGRTATRYKVDTRKVAATVRAELTKKKDRKAATSKSKKLPRVASVKRESSTPKSSKEGK